jgi:hypothetical protein
MLRKVLAVNAMPFIKATTTDWYLPSRQWFTAEEILSGKRDNYFEDAADVCRTYANPMFLSWNHEMTGDWLPYSDKAKRPAKADENFGWSPSDFVAVWKRIHRIFRERGATNVAFVWSPAIDDAPSKVTPISESRRLYWPGINYVDWIGPSLYNNTDPAQLRRLAEVFPERPIFISEWGTAKIREKWYQRGRYPGDGAWMDAVFKTMLDPKVRVRGIAWYQWERDYDLGRNPEQLLVYKKWAQRLKFEYAK